MANEHEQERGTSMLTVGARLRRRRETKGWSLEEVSRATKIHVNVLALIEADQATASVNPVYLKGFIKTYGGYLGEDVPALLAMVPLPAGAPVRLVPSVERQTAGAPPASRAAAAVRRAVAEGWQRLPWRRLAVAGAVLVLVWAGGARIRSAMLHKTRSARPPAAAATGAVKTSAKPQLQRAAPHQPTPARTPLPVAVQRRQTGQAGAAAAAKKKTRTAPAAPAAAEQVRLTVYVHSMTWMQVKADGSVVFQDVLQPDARETWLARREIIVWLGDAGGVTLELNGRPLGAPGKRGEIVRALRITSQGMQR